MIGSSGGPPQGLLFGDTRKREGERGGEREREERDCV